MNLRLAIAFAAMLAATACGNREAAPIESVVIRPDRILDFATLYSDNCGGCHGPNGQGGAALALANPVYLAIAGDSVIRNAAAQGVAGTLMPAFARSAGGALTDQQIDSIVGGIRRWAKSGALSGQTPPPYSSEGSGDATRGASAYETYCSSCHGAGGRGGAHAGSIVDTSYLALVSNQGLRTTVIAGRPELGSPDWRNAAPGKTMSDQDVSDVVAWLAAQRPQISARK
jgi:cytochrome c oxidase cbb3-type subunit III